jgi:hypothetical protein
MGSMWRVLIGCLLVVGACGGSDSTSVDAIPSDTVIDSESETPTEGGQVVVFRLATLDPSAVDVASELVQMFGDDGGFVALVSALERGYVIDQIATAVFDARIDLDGVILTADGGTEAPDGPRIGVVALPNDVDGEAGSDEEGAAADIGPIGLRYLNPGLQDEPFEPFGLLGQLRDQLGDSIEPEEDPGAVLIGIIVELSINGYGLAQIVDALVLGDGFLVRARGCTALSRGIGLTVVPAAPADSECSVLLSEDAGLEGSVDDVVDGTDAPADSEPRSDDVSVLVGVYEGTVDLVQCGVSCGFECPVSTTITIALGPDGTLTGGFDAQARWNSTACVNPPLSGRNPFEGLWEEDGNLAFSSPNVFGFTAEGFVVGGVLTAMLVESGTAENAPGDGTGTVVQFDAQAVKTR